MVRGYYTATSGIITQSKTLNTISNNLANASTPGYKSDSLAAITFNEVLNQQTGNSNKSNSNPTGTTSMIVTADRVHTDHSQGIVEFTGRNYDFAIQGSGFFRIQTDNGQMYTRNGSFTVDSQGYLALANVGRVMGENGPIYIGNDTTDINTNGEVFRNGVHTNTIDVVDFNNYDQLIKSPDGLFVNNNAQNIVGTDAKIMKGSIERSNMDSTQQMTAMLVSQRALQSCSQIVKMYDGMLEKAVSQLGRV